MNKQEAIEKLKSKAKPHWLDEEIYGDSCIKSVELCMAIEIVNQIDEPEKLYTVEIPNHNGGTYLALCKDVDGKLFFDVFLSKDWKTYGKCKLTESEIKQDFAWAWQFAKEVEE